MAMPKKRMSHVRSGTRRSQIKATLPGFVYCPNCHAPRLAHTVCPECGFYRGRSVVEKTVKTAATPSTETVK
jgi:large subunit ribosomal protein L32